MQSIHKHRARSVFWAIAALSVLATAAHGSVIYSLREIYTNGPLNIHDPADHSTFEADATATVPDFLQDGSTTAPASGRIGGGADGGVYGGYVEQMVFNVANNGSSIYVALSGCPLGWPVSGPECPTTPSEWTFLNGGGGFTVTPGESGYYSVPNAAGNIGYGLIGQSTLSITDTCAVPEPSSFGFAAIAGIAALACRRRKWLMLLVAAASTLEADPQLVPAGTTLPCTISERISSQTVGVGDPILCQLRQSSAFPYGTVLTGQFEDAKEPGHFLGKGWMDLNFQRVLMPQNEPTSINAKVVGAKGYRTDTEGHILGKGHATRDIVKWMIPLLWPIDLLTLPARGPRPTLKPETQLTVKLMNDVVFERPVYSYPVQPRDPHGFTQRAPVSYVQEPPPVFYEAPSEPVYQYASAPRSWEQPTAMVQYPMAQYPMAQYSEPTFGPAFGVGVNYRVEPHYRGPRTEYREAYRHEPYRHEAGGPPSFRKH